jgi:signal peptidase II
VLGSMVRATPATDRFRLAALALVCGGAAGNLVDRIRSPQGVVDFLDVGIGAWRWPTFNVADSAITVGAIALAISLWLEGRAPASAKEAQAAEP